MVHSAAGANVSHTPHLMLQADRVLVYAFDTKLFWSSRVQSLGRKAFVIILICYFEYWCAVQMALQ